MSRRVVSFSLWGDRPKYLEGALRNAELCPRFYPGWTLRFYVGSDVPGAVVARLREHGAEIVARPSTGDWRGAFWRFETATDPGAAVVIFRDCDSRPGARETAAVDEWLRGRARFHLMRDHPWHVAPVLGGMWGVRGNLPAALVTPDATARGPLPYDSDQRFLAERLFPRMRGDACVHDEFFGGRRFPLPRQGLEFVGCAFDEHGCASLEHQHRLAAALQAGPGLRCLRRLLGRWIVHRGRMWRFYVWRENADLRRQARPSGPDRIRPLPPKP